MNIMKLAVNTNTNVTVHWYGWQALYVRQIQGAIIE